MLRELFAVAQAGINIAAALGAISGPLIIGALTKGDIENGWRKFYVSSPMGCFLLDLNLYLSGFKWVCGD